MGNFSFDLGTQLKLQAQNSWLWSNAETKWKWNEV